MGLYNVKPTSALLRLCRIGGDTANDNAPLNLVARGDLRESEICKSSAELSSSYTAYPASMSLGMCSHVTWHGLSRRASNVIVCRLRGAAAGRGEHCAFRFRNIFLRSFCCMTPSGSIALLWSLLTKHLCRRLRCPEW